MSYTEQDAAEARYEARMERRRNQCQCGYPDWPGSCPGPENCPCCQTEDEPR